MDSLSLQGQTLRKTKPITQHSIAYLQDRKKNIVAIAQPKAIHMYNVQSNKFQDQIQMKNHQSQISCLTVSDDLVFFACGMIIAAAGTNGKVIFEFDTFMAAERIDMVVVTGYRLWIISGNLINQFKLGGAQLNNKKSRKGQSPNPKTEDAHSYAFQSKINGCALIEQQLEKPFLLLLKNNNQIICYDTKELCQLKTKFPPTTLCLYENNNIFLVGTMQGQILKIEATRKEIKQIWILHDNSTGRVNCMMKGKNQNFIVFRDDKMEIWGQDRSLLGEQPMDQKIMSVEYVPEKQVAICGSASGTISLMCDYLQLMKNFQEQNAEKNKANLEKQITSLKKQLEFLQNKLNAGKKGKGSSKGITANYQLNIDYNNFCSCLEITSEYKIFKVIIKAEIDLLKSEKITFEGKQEDASVFVLEDEGVYAMKILFKVEEKYYENLKMRVVVYGMRNGEMYGVSRNLDLKPLSLHHKISSCRLSTINKLSITGDFKYFEMNGWLNGIFNDFGPSGDSGNEFSLSFYESLLSKNKLLVRYKNSQCEVQAENPTPLVVVRKFLFEKSKDKHRSLNFSVELSIESIQQLVSKFGKSIRPLLDLKKKSQLLPGLLQLKNQSCLGYQLANILDEQEEIRSKLAKSSGQYQGLVNEVKNCFIAYRTLKDREINRFDLDTLERALQNFDENIICKLILE